MSNASEAQKALAEHQKMIDGREAICNLASKPQGRRRDDFPMRPSHHYRRRDDFHHHRGPPGGQGRFGRKPGDNAAHNRVQPPPAPYPNPYGYDYSAYQYPGAVAPMNPYAGMNPYANPYAQYNRNAAAAAAAA